MSREIKFRIWDSKNKEWLGTSDNDTLIYYGFHLVGEVMTVQAPPQWALDDGNIVEQYTGLKDKNGKEIYEGDIIQEDIDFNSKMTDGTFRYRVYWDNDMLTWSLDPIGDESIHDELWETNSSREVIGNIHEPIDKSDRV